MANITNNKTIGHKQFICLKCTVNKCDFMIRYRNQSMQNIESLTSQLLITFRSSDFFLSQIFYLLLVFFRELFAVDG